MRISDLLCSKNYFFFSVFPFLNAAFSPKSDSGESRKWIWPITVSESEAFLVVVAVLCRICCVLSWIRSMNL